ncbi:hypothetical protein [Actinopolyspora halophila]|uniref:hypothetical protein n=1 Tax=Actinopolyspora halophila TaxID=1850 RepID=UPI00037D7480|nr:hypothetical protein [Actinopolyspora halophila]
MTALTALLVLTVLELVLDNGFGGVAFAAAGALLGAIVLPAGVRTGLLLGSFLFGLRVRNVVIGAMRRVTSFRLGGVLVTVRALPVVLSSDIGPRREPVVTRCVLAAVSSTLAGLLVIGACLLVADSSFGHGLVLATTASMIHTLIPRRAPLNTSTGWLLFGLPRMSEPRRLEFRTGAHAAEAHALLQDGELDAAETVVDELAEIAPHARTTASCRATVHEARGEFDKATMLLLHTLSTHSPEAREMSYLLAGLAGLALAAVEAGQLPSADLTPTAEQALHDSVDLGFPRFELSGTFGLLALVNGETERATHLAELGTRHATSGTTRADNLATLARAHMARGDNVSARAALAEAEGLAAWWPRVRSTRQRLTIC